MKPIAMIMTLAAGLTSFGLAASAENSTKEPTFRSAHAAPATMPMSGTSAFLPMTPTQGTQPAWVTYGSLPK